MQEVYSNESGAVLRDGDRVRIDYVPEPGVKTSFGVLTGGEAYLAEDVLVVEFEQLVRAAGSPGHYRKVTLVASEGRPRLLELARRALEETEAPGPEEMGDR